MAFICVHRIENGSGLPAKTVARFGTERSNAGLQNQVNRGSGPHKEEHCISLGASDSATMLAANYQMIRVIIRTPS